MNPLRHMADRSLRAHIADLEVQNTSQGLEIAGLLLHVGDLTADKAALQRQVDGMQSELEILHEQNSSVDALHERQLVKRDNQIARLDIENNSLRAKQFAMAEAHAAGTSELQGTIAELRRALEEKGAVKPAAGGAQMSAYPPFGGAR